MSGEPRIHPDLERKIYKLYIVENLSATLVAERLSLTGRGVVSGIAMRRGWKKSAEAIKLGHIKNREAKAAVAREARSRPSRAKTSPHIEKAATEPPGPSGVVLMSLLPHHCRYPSGEGEAIWFCGEPKAIGAYCQAHARLCFWTERVPDKRLDRLARLG